MNDRVYCPKCGRWVEPSVDYGTGVEVRCPECGAGFDTGAPVGISPRPLPPIARDERSQSITAQPTSDRQPAYLDDDIPDLAKPGRPYRPSGGLGIAVKALLALNLLFSVASIIGNYDFVRRLEENQPMVNDLDDLAFLVIGVGSSIVYLTTAIVYLIWFYRMSANLEPLEAHDVRHTPRWAAGFWFVPILNLYRPVQIAQEIYRKSDPSLADRDVDAPDPSSSALIGFWWAAWIISQISANVAVRMTWDANGPSAERAAAMVTMASEVGNIIAAIFAILVVRLLERRQSERAAALRLELRRDRDFEAGF